MTICYRLYTEDVNYDAINIIVGEMFTSYTLIKGMGVWNRVKEKSVIIEIISDDSDNVLNKIRSLASTIKIVNYQEAVLITQTAIIKEII